jgi:hypothetical protein
MTRSYVRVRLWETGAKTVGGTFKEAL